MDSSTFKTLHKYGAMLSIVGIALAVLAYVVGGPIGTTALLFFGWAGPLGLLYFGGAYLTYSTSYTSAYHELGEELMRGVAWYFVSLIGWSVIATQTAALSASAVSVFGLPAVTALGMTFVMVGTRYVTGSDLKVESEGGQLLMMIAGGIVFGFLALYLSLTEEWGWWVFGLYLVSIPVGVGLWWAIIQRYPGGIGVN